MDWTYKNKKITDIVPGKIGFIYIITELDTGKKYIGKKNFYFGKGKKQKESDWKKYWGSNKELKSNIKNNPSNYKRHIIMFCERAKELSYREAELLFKHKVLESNKYYNSNILGKFYTRDLLKTRNMSE